MRDDIIQALERHIARRSGMDWRNYNGNRAAFMGDYNPMIRAGREARQMLAYIRPRSSIGADQLLEAMGNGRLTYDPERREIDYCVGQYWATEYRAAACQVLARAIRAYLREPYPGRTLNPAELYRSATRELGRGLASRWFR